MAYLTVNNYEVEPCKVVTLFNADEVVEICNEKDAEFWSVYNKSPEGFSDQEEDFDTLYKAINYIAELIFADRRTL